MTMSLTDGTSQATRVEQARAVAEVVASVQAAQTRPRNEDDAVVRFLRSCQRKQFADRAFWRYARGGQQLTGPTIDFALEALRCWGNAVSGTAELERRATESEMIAFAWDLETNTQRRITFVNPHTGYVDTPKMNEDGTPKPLRKMVAVRDIRENNASAGSRVEREAVMSVLPSWFIEIGIAACYATLAGDQTVPIEDRRRDSIVWFEQIGVSRATLEAKLGVPSGSWVDADLAQLRVIATEIKRGSTTVEAEFRGLDRPTVPGADRSATKAASLGDGVDTAPVDRPQGDRAGAADGAAVDTTPAPAARLNEVFALFAGVGLGGRGDRVRAQQIRVCEIVTGATIASRKDITGQQADMIVNYLRSHDTAAVAALLDEDERERAADAARDDEEARS